MRDTIPSVCADVAACLTQQEWQRIDEASSKNDMLLMQGNERSFTSVFSWSGLNEVLTFRNLDFPRCKLIKNGRALEPAKYLKVRSDALGERVRGISVEKIASQLESGVTLVIENLDDLWPAVRGVKIALESRLGEKVGATLFVGTGQSAGFTTHWDDGDVLVYQIQGQKRWQLHEPSVISPMKDIHGTLPPPTTPPVWDRIIAPGDVLYLPRGWWHTPIPINEPCMHISFGFRRRTAMDFFRWLSPYVAESPVWRQNLTRDKLPPVESQLEALRSALKQLLDEPNLLDRYLESMGDGVPTPQPLLVFDGAGVHCAYRDKHVAKTE
ncbi:hypothetical protein FNZ07_13085 (plasmid) [Paraburkholderia megapolitana]|uniref:Cupin superfamily protein n=2 Tax=Paraburkholderia megapolitana TaxID=420953 RepID=A0A1I3WBQ3_9BURK|nr:hypothetical protein FNZ07_13085 [Paraburkholderia megapolitana]SFK04177.1 Cupin superfamily protein [Paraburkholderia megapolitana]